MCGIAGVYWHRGRVCEDQMRRMAQDLQHRGPDDFGLHIDRGLGLVHTRLSIIDLGGGHQPLHNQDRSLSAVVNGEIYNYLELQEAQRQRGVEFATASDSETLLKSYELDALEGLNSLRGMYAFALFDAREQTLHIGRDRLGIKPMYYAELPDGVAFASEMRVLTPLLENARALNPEAFASYLQHQFSSGRDTLVEGIKRVLPGEVISISQAGKVTHQRYWCLTQVRPQSLTFDQAQEQFDTLMDDVMREHMRSDVPYGLFLSGGVDSAILCAELQKRRETPIQTFSIGFEEGPVKCEIDDAERIAKRFGTDHHTFRVNHEQLFQRMPHMVWACDELMRDAACLATSLLAERAAQSLKVVFTGEGGDEVFAGYGRYRRGAFQSWLKSLRHPGSGGFRTRGSWPVSRLSTLAGPALQSANTRHNQAFVQAWSRTPNDWRSLQRRQYTDLTTALPDNLLVKADRMLMGFGLEGRVPFLDHRVVEFGLSLPDGLKINKRQGKWFLKRWAERQLPKDHLYAKKRGFGVPLDEWLQGPRQPAIGEKLLANPAIRDWFNPEGLRKALAERNVSTNELFCLIQFALWHRFMIEQPHTVPGRNDDLLDWL